MKNKYLMLGIATALPFGFASTVLAQSVPSSQSDALTAYHLSGTSISGSSRPANAMLTAPVDTRAAAIKTESGVYLYPTIATSVGYNDNLQTTNTNTTGSGFVHIAPQLVAELKNNGDRYTALAAVNVIKYNSSSDDDYVNSNFEIAGDNYFSSRARAGWAVGRVSGIDPRGSNNRTVSSQPDRWHVTSAKGRLVYGAPEAIGRVELDFGTQVKAYDNNRDTTAVADLTLNSVAARAYYRLGTRTSALAEIRNARANYASSLATDSNTERHYLLGVTWEATAATKGIIKVGHMTKNFDLAGKTGYSGTSLEAAVQWLPVSYSAFDITAIRSTADSTGFGNYDLNTGVDLVWTHKWNQSVSSRVAVGTLTTDFGGTNRTDKASKVALSVDYSMRRWLNFGVSFDHTDNSSNDAAAAFKRNVTMLTMNATF